MRRGPKIKGGVFVKRSTAGERRNMAPEFSQLWLQYVDLQLRAQEMVPVTLLPQSVLLDPADDAVRDVDGQLDMVAARQDFENRLGFFIQSDRIIDLDDDQKARLILMCVAFPPFRVAVVGNLMTHRLTDCPE